MGDRGSTDVGGWGWSPERRRRTRVERDLRATGDEAKAGLRASLRKSVRQRGGAQLGWGWFMADVTLASIARQAGVNRSTVSLALRNHPRIPEVTRQRIRRLADALGYRPNPMVSALMQLRRSADPRPRQTALAYMTAFPTRTEWRRNPPDFFPGAKQRALELGYSLEDFWLHEPGMSPRRLADILLARGIRGLILARTPPGVSRLEFPWEDFATVSLGVMLESPPTHHVAHHHFDDAAAAWTQCRTRGYGRVGLALMHYQFPRSQRRWLGAFEASQRDLAPRDRVPACGLAAPSPEKLAAWVRRERVEAIMTGEVEATLECLRQAGLRVPQDVALVALNLFQKNPALAGMYHDPARTGIVAVDMLTAQLYRNETGLPGDPAEVLLNGHWRDGASLPVRSR